MGDPVRDLGLGLSRYGVVGNGTLEQNLVLGQDYFLELAKQFLAPVLSSPIRVSNLKRIERYSSPDILNRYIHDGIRLVDYS